MTPKEAELHDRIKAGMGTAIMIAASCLAVLIFSDRMDMKMFELPAIWYASRQFHLLTCGLLFVVAAILLKSPVIQEHRTAHPLFHTCRLMTRADCSLCDDALTTLLEFQEWLPKIDVVDIDEDALLTRQFGESIPVVEIDGRVRFRGAVNSKLLQRMIDAALLRERNLPGVTRSGFSRQPLESGNE